MRNLLVQLFRRRTLRKILLALFFLAMSLAIMVVPLESRRPDAQIKNLEDSIWWAMTTITTVGYGDIVPVTREGRILGMILMIMGVVMFGSIVGTLVSELNRKRDYYEWERIAKKLDQLTNDLAELKKKTDYVILQGADKKTK